MATSLPDATSSEGSCSPASVSSVARRQAVPAPPAKKKRVRRQQVELKYLRELAGQLELRLEHLKKRRVGGAQRAGNSSGGSSSSCSTPQLKYGPVSVWEAISHRQFTERSRVEMQNAELKRTLRTQSIKAQMLQRKMQKALGEQQQQQTDLAMIQLQSQGSHFWNLSDGDEEAIFSDLLALVARVHLELQRRQAEDPRSMLALASWGISVGDPCVRVDTAAGLVMEMHGRSLLPFNVKTTAAACWRMFSLSRMNHKVSFENTFIDKDDLAARTFTCSSTQAGHQFHARGKHTCRRYVEEDGCVTIVYAGRTGPAHPTSPCQQVQLENTGWIKVRQVRSLNADGQSSAILEMHTKMLPRFQAGATDQDRQAREVFDWIKKSHQMTNDWYRQTLSEILVEEDWKAFHEDNSAMSVC